MTSLIRAILRKLVSCFLAGVFSLLPLIVTAAVVIWVAGIIGGVVGPNTFVGQRLKAVGMEIAPYSPVAYLTGWVAVLAIVFVVGIVVEMGAKKLLSQLVETIVQRIPIVGSIYGTSKQLVGMLDKKDEADLKGMSVVFCTFGQQAGCGLLGLLVSPERFAINGREYVIVIVPTAPVPVGGGLLFVPSDAVTRADVSVDGLMSIYVSMGVTAPEFIPAVKPGLA